MREVIKILDRIEHDRSHDGPKREILVTAPHASNKQNPIDDPCTHRIAQGLNAYIPTCLNVNCATFIASRARTHADQNRLAGLLEADDLYPQLKRYLVAKGRSLGDVLHVDVHSFQPNVGKLPKGWGRGINILHLLGDEKQRGFAQRMAASLNMTLDGLIPPATVVEHPKLPRTPADDDGNAMIEWSRHHGGLGVLLELPVQRNGKLWKLLCPEHALLSAMVYALGEELSR